MIILADIPFFDAFTYAKKMTSDGVIDFWSSGEPLPSSDTIRAGTTNFES